MYQQLKKAYEGKKIFLTGHTGFKGSWMLGILKQLDAVVKGYALEPRTKDDLFNLIGGDVISESVIGDLLDIEKLHRAIENFQPDYIFHFAAQPLVRLSYEIPEDTFQVNAIGTANLLGTLRSLAKKVNVILITTDKVYHNNEWLFPYRENDRLGGFDPYSASKACAEIIISSYRNSFFHIDDYATHQKAIAVGRAGNVIGGGDWSKDRLMPDIAKTLSAGMPVEIRNPQAVRPWQHVLEPLVGYLLLGIKVDKNPNLFSQAYNFGPHIDDTLSVKKMVDMAMQRWGSGSSQTSQLTGQPHEAGLLKLDISKAIGEIGWKPSLKASGAVALTIDWYKTFYEDRKSINEFTANQIKRFLDNE